MKTAPKKAAEKVLRFESRQGVWTASTEDARLIVPVRILSAILGLFLNALGLGMLALMFHELHRTPGEALSWLRVLFMGIVFSLYGINLVGRGISGRPWGRRFWTAAGAWIAAHVRPWPVALVLFVVIAVPAVVGWGHKGPAELEGLMLLVAGFLHVACHELGHLAAARAVGYRPRWLAAGPLVVRARGAGPRFALNRSWLQFFGGFAAYEPVRRTRAKDFLVIAAGPLTNLLLAASALQTWGWPNPASAFEVFLRSFIGLGIAITLFNLLPLPRTTEGFALDGREMLDLLR